MKNNNGVTLLELLLSIFASSLLAIAVAGLFVSYIKSDIKMKNLMQLRRQFAYANQLLERDIRMAGLNLPGNGIIVNVDTPEDHTMHLLKNEEGLKTMLSQSAITGDNYIRVANAYTGDVSIEDWVCLSDPAEDDKTEYLKIVSEPEVLFDGSYNLSFGSEVLKNSWDNTKTDVYFAKAVKYSVDVDSDTAFVRSTALKDFRISEDIKKFIITPFNALGEDLTDLLPGSESDIRRVGIELIKPIPERDNSISSSIEVSIRNYL